MDYSVIKKKKAENRYNLKPKSLKKLKVLDWERFKQNCWLNIAIDGKNNPWWCHTEGSDGGGFYDDADEFWIGVRESDGKVRYHFTAGEGMLRYQFDEFYNPEEIENQWDLNVQVNALKWLNKMIDEEILGA